MPTDPFSDVLHLTEARSVIAAGLVAGGAWALRFPPPGEIKFFVVTRGTCWLRLDGHKRAVRLEPGDVGLLPGRDGFLVASKLTAPPRDARRLFAKRTGAVARIGDGSEFAGLAGGVSLDPSSAALLTDVLPALVHVRGASPRAATLRWIVEQLVEERGSALPGGDVASAQLAQLLFVQVLRFHLANGEALPVGWLRASCDARLVRALSAMHGKPGRAWKLHELARVAAMSRTSFAVRFKSVAGVAPLAYLAQWRMRLAQRSLRRDDLSVAALAGSLGYASESAFSHAFKRVTGSRPRDYRSAARRSE